MTTQLQLYVPGKISRNYFTLPSLSLNCFWTTINCTLLLLIITLYLFIFYFLFFILLVVIYLICMIADFICDFELLLTLSLQSDWGFLLALDYPR